MKGIIIVLVVLLAAYDSWAQLSVSADGRYLAHPDHGAFIWIGDTAWELLHKLDREQAIHYLDDRQAKGFTVIQTVVLAELDGLRTPNAFGDVPLHDLDPERPNEAYFAHVDFVVAEAAKRGMHLGLLPTWGDKVPSEHPGSGPVVFTPENAASFGSFLGERYRDAPIIWILGGDRTVNDDARAIWDAMGRAIKEATRGQQLLTFHPRGGRTSADWFADSDWIDFHMYQSGHASRNLNLSVLLQRSLLATPRRPAVDGEPAYEDIAVRFWEYLPVPPDVLDDDGFIARPEHFEEGFITPHDVRVHAFWDFLGGAAGYTYGHNAVWQMRRPGDSVAIPTFRTWREALQRPGAAQMAHLKALWESRPLSKLRPGGEFLLTQDIDGVAAAGSSDNSYAMVYLPDGGTIEIDMSKLKANRLQAWWFNPSTGTAEAAGEFEGYKVATFAASDSEGYRDWLLVLDDVSAGYPAPGSSDYR
ncbi:MAG: glycoside hydrolase family 140 protein [Woeseiaceae bacterium]